MMNSSQHFTLLARRAGGAASVLANRLPLIPVKLHVRVYSSFKVLVAEVKRVLSRKNTPPPATPA